MGGFTLNWGLIGVRYLLTQFRGIGPHRVFPIKGLGPISPGYLEGVPKGVPGNSGVLPENLSKCV